MARTSRSGRPRRREPPRRWSGCTITNVGRPWLSTTSPCRAITRGAAAGMRTSSARTFAPRPYLSVSTESVRVPSRDHGSAGTEHPRLSIGPWDRTPLPAPGAAARDVRRALPGPARRHRPRPRSARHRRDQASSDRAVAVPCGRLHDRAGEHDARLRLGRGPAASRGVQPFPPHRDDPSHLGRGSRRACLRPEPLPHPRRGPRGIRGRARTQARPSLRPLGRPARLGGVRPRPARSRTGANADSGRGRPRDGLSRSPMERWPPAGDASSSAAPRRGGTWPPRRRHRSSMDGGRDVGT